MSRSFLISVCLIVLCAPPALAEDLYQCVRKDKKSFITNTPAEYRAAGARCWLVMKGSPSPNSGASDKKAKRKKKRRSSYRPTTKPSRTIKEAGSATERYGLYAPYVREAAGLYKLPESFIRAVMRVESSFHYKAVSSAGAQGLMQLMPGTAREMGVHDSFDPRQNIMGGAKLLRLLANRFDGDFAKVLSAYHAGSGAVRAKGGIPYEATEGYVRAVMDHYYRYKAEATD